MADSNVRFVRINGRVVPIKVQPGSGIRGGGYRAARNNTQRVGNALAAGGAAAVLVNEIGSHLVNSGVESKLARFTLRHNKPMLFGGLAAAVSGLLASNAGNKRRSRETRALNTITVPERLMWDQSKGADAARRKLVAAHYRKLESGGYK